MPNDTRTPAEIEREIERERAGLTNTLDSLQDKFSVETIARQLSDQFREHGGDIGRSVSDAVKRNPIGLALTGVGLAWLMLGDKSTNSGNDDDGYSRRGRSRGSDDLYDVSSRRSGLADRANTQGRQLGPQPGDRSKPYFSGRSGNQTDVPAWARPDDENAHNSTGSSSSGDAAASVGSSISGAAASTTGGVRKAGAAIADTATSAADAVTESVRSMADSAQSFATSAAERAEALRERLAHGTETLTEEARIRVIAARERAIEARDAALEYSRQGREKAADMFDEHPLIAGALAVAVGAAFAAALPRTRTEDAYLGDQSDHLFQEAERVFADEKAKLSKVAEAATDEAKKVLDEAKGDLADQAKSVSEKAKASGERIVDAATTEAKKQDLGTVKNL